MAKTSFTFDEMVYNTVVSGKQIYYENETKTIDYVKMVKDTRQVQVICTDGDVFLANQDDEFFFEVNTPKPLVEPNKPKLKGNKK
jgi:hypothetical protein